MLGGSVRRSSRLLQSDQPTLWFHDGILFATDVPGDESDG